MNKIKFSKLIVISCIIFVVLYTIVQTWLNYMLAIEISPTLTTCVYAFFGTELAATALIRIFDSKSSDKYEDVQSELVEETLDEDAE